MTRQHKTDLQRAEERLGIEQRRVKKLEERLANQRGIVDATFTELQVARERLAYAKRDPALQPPAEDEPLPDPAATDADET